MTAANTGVRLTQEQFVEKASAKHNNFYDYSNVVYVRSSDKVKIICPSHGEFLQQPNNHLQGQGCPSCKKLKIGKVLRSSTESFVSGSKKVHNDAFDYSRVDYTTNSYEVDIRCVRHDHWFKQRPATHLKYNGCPLCKSEKLSVANTSNTEEFVRKSRERHGEKYDYSRSEYTEYFGKVEILCPEHGVFLQRAGWHIIGSGCPSCAHGGYSSNKAGTLYVLVDGNVTKVGITNFSAKDRMDYINPKSPYSFTVFREYSQLDGVLCEETEYNILAFLRGKYESPTDKYPGYTESFFNVDRQELLSMLDTMLERT